MATYNDRPMLVEFLKIAYFSDAMKLRDYLLVMLGSNEIVATTRGRAIIHDKYSDSYQFLSVKQKGLELIYLGARRQKLSRLRAS